MNSILQTKKECYVCHNTLYLHKHHIYEGRNRNNSEKHGCWIWLCPKHHNMSDEGIHFNKSLDTEVKQTCEKAWLEHNSATIDDFRSIFYTNYL